MSMGQVSPVEGRAAWPPSNRPDLRRKSRVAQVKTSEIIRSARDEVRRSLGSRERPQRPPCDRCRRRSGEGLARRKAHDGGVWGTRRGAAAAL